MIMLTDIDKFFILSYACSSFITFLHRIKCLCRILYPCLRAVHMSRKMSEIVLSLTFMLEDDFIPFCTRWLSCSSWIIWYAINGVSWRKRTDLDINFVLIGQNPIQRYSFCGGGTWKYQITDPDQRLWLSRHTPWGSWAFRRWTFEWN